MTTTTKNAPIEINSDDTTSFSLLEAPATDEERSAFIRLDPAGFFIRQPPKPHELASYITANGQLFQTIHMGAAVVDEGSWRLVVKGMVQNPFALDYKTLLQLPSRTITAVHECYGPPTKPPTTALWRVGNVRWTGVPLNNVLNLAKPLPGASFVWSDGLDRGEFAGVKSDRYQKDLPMEKAMEDQVLLAYKINDEPLERKHGGPVRLIVPGWFGTNSTKWICNIELQDRRSPGVYTTNFYNEQIPGGKPGAMRPVWSMEPNSFIAQPAPDEEVVGPDVSVEGWAWSVDPIALVEVSTDEGNTWTAAAVEARIDFSWQRFSVVIYTKPGDCVLMARAKASDGRSQPLQGRRNHCHRVALKVIDN